MDELYTNLIITDAKQMIVGGLSKTIVDHHSLDKLLQYGFAIGSISVMHFMPTNLWAFFPSPEVPSMFSAI